MRMAHVLTFYDSLSNVLFLNHFVRVLTHTRHYTPEVIGTSSENEDESYGCCSQDWSRQWTPLIPDLPRKLKMKEEEVTAHTDSESQHSGEEEVIEETYETEDSRENIQVHLNKLECREKVFLYFRYITCKVKQFVLILRIRDYSA